MCFRGDINNKRASHLFFIRYLLTLRVKIPPTGIFTQKFPRMADV